MATKFGNREKMIVGSVVGLAAIAAVHFFVFQAPAKQAEALMGQRNELQSQFEKLNSLPDPATIETYRKEGVEQEKILWQTVVDENLLMGYPFLMNVPPQDPGPTAPEDQKAVYQKALAEYNAKAVEYKTAASGLLANQIKRLDEMKAAYERGQAWQGDLPSASGNAATNRMRLTFLDATPTGWSLPTLPRTASAQLWRAVNDVYNAWQSWALLNANSPDYAPATMRYIGELQKIGLSQAALMRTDFGEHLPALLKLHLARLIWDSKAADETVPVGGQPLTLPRLQEMLGVELPEMVNLFFLYRQFRTLEEMLVRARKNGIEAVTTVVLPQEYRVVSYDREMVLKAKQEAVDAATAERTDAQVMPEQGRGGAPDRFSNAPYAPDGAGGDPRANFARGGARGETAPARGGARGAPAGAARGAGARGATAPGNPEPGGATAAMPGMEEPSYTENKTERGFAILVHMVYEATNENSMRFLYEVVRAPEYYKIEGLTITAQENNKVQATLSVEKVVLLDTLSPPGAGLVDPQTLELVDLLPGQENTGKARLAAKTEALKARGIDEEATIADALAQAGITPWKPEDAATAAESAPATEPAPATQPEPAATPAPTPAP